jgi:hypothetical protein
MILGSIFSTKASSIAGISFRTMRIVCERPSIARPASI